MECIRPWLVALAMLCCGMEAGAQAAQAAAHLEFDRADMARDSVAKARNQALALVAQVEVAASRIDATRGGDAAVARARAQRLLALGEEIRRTSTRDGGLVQLLRDFESERDALALLEQDTGSQSMRDVGQAAQKRAAAPTFLGALDPRIAFTAGLALESCKECQNAEVATNLAGAAIGGAIGALGAPEALKGYVERNVALSLALPLRKLGSIASGVSLGLGSANILQRALWPVLGVQQVDSSNGALPAEIRALEPTRATWSTPFVGIGFTWFTREQVKKLLSERKTVPVLSIGARLPQYYPGDATAGLAALFSGGQGKYRRSGSVQWSISVSIPLFRVDSP